MGQILIPHGSTVSLHHVLIADDRELVFSNKTAQWNYYSKYCNKVFNAVSVVKRGTNQIKLQMTMGEATQNNMISFINPDFDNKRFYAKIIDYEYGNNNMTILTYEIDYWQTFMFDISYYASMIEREHLSEALYQQALANPQDDSIIELRTPEDITIPEEAYTYTNDGNSSWGAPSLIVPSTNNDPVLLIQMAPFELYDESEEVNADGKTLKQLLQEYDTANGGNATGFGAVLKDWAINDGDDGSKDTGGISMFGKFVEGFGHVAGVDGADGFTKFIKGRKAIIDNFKPVKRSDKATWNMFRSLFPEFKEPHLAQGAAITTYNAILEYSEWGRNRLQQAIDFLTLQGVSASILGIYIVPRYTLSETIVKGQIIEITNPSNSRHPKLNTGEFSYVSVQAPDGSKREYRFENFLDNKKHRFAVQASLLGNPVITFAPINYLQQSSDGMGISIENSIDFDNFPHLPYSTDGYLTYLSGQMLLGQMLKSAKSKMDRSINAVGTIGSSILSGAQSGLAVPGGPGGALAGAVGGAITGFSTNTMSNINNNMMLSDSQMLSGANPSIVQQIKNGDVPSKLWDGSQKAFVQDNYNPGSTHGWLPYLYSGIRFRLDFKYINDAYKDRYEKYFDHYGYKSTRFGEPRVGLWALGDVSQEPHWETINGVSTTYVKTDGCRVLGPFLNATRSIQNMFDSGVRFIKGDNL